MIYLPQWAGGVQLTSPRLTATDDQYACSPMADEALSPHPAYSTDEPHGTRDLLRLKTKLAARKAIDVIGKIGQSPGQPMFRLQTNGV
jgi:hypothetical protein